MINAYNISSTGGSIDPKPSSSPWLECAVGEKSVQERRDHQHCWNFDTHDDDFCITSQSKVLSVVKCSVKIAAFNFVFFIPNIILFYVKLAQSLQAVGLSLKL